jgi:hypothetical protein
MAKASDNVFPSILLAEGSAPSSPSAGQHRLFVDTADDTLKRKDSAGVVTPIGSSSGFGAWTTYTPALVGSTTNPTLGTGGSITGRYRTCGDDGIEGVISVTFGTSGASAGSGAYTLSLPAGITLPATPAKRAYGSGWAFDGTSTVYHLVPRRSTSTTFDLAINGNGIATNSLPFTWTNNSLMEITFSGQCVIA